MDEGEARTLLTEKVESLRALSYEELCQCIATTRRLFGIEFAIGEESVDLDERFGPSGTWYQPETAVLWDDERGGTLRIVVAIDDGGESATRPLTDGFLLASDGSFVDE